MSAKKTTAEFIAEAAKLHCGKYSYAKTLYRGAKHKVTITCPIHGDFEQFPTNHLRPCGCPGCTGEAIRKARGFGASAPKPAPMRVSRVLTNEQFVKLATARHNGKYSYENSDYKSGKELITVTCPIHGDFQQKASAHLFGKGCLQCSNNTPFTTEMFIERSRSVHGDKYSYEKTKYVQALKKVIITCPNHGDFEQKADAHLEGQGCKLCHDKALSMTLEEFVEKANRVHADKFDYSKVEYKGAAVKVEITCPDHGVFFQPAAKHLFGDGCPKCACVGKSKPETELFNFIQALAPDAVQSDRIILGGKEIDVLVPSKMIGFEFNGLYWHSEATGTPMNYHQDKSDAAIKAGVRLIHIFEDEWRDNRAWCESHIRNVLNAPATTIHGRKCQVELADTASGVREFLETNHIQGFRGGRSIVLRYEGKIVAAAIIAKTATGESELARWCVKLGVRVVGGFQKVMTHIPSGTISFCDTGKYDGAGYEAAGWIKASEGVSSYHYTDFVERKGRQGFQKHKLLARGAVGDNEVELAASEGFYRIGGLRQLKFVKA